jgi:hypothetical protein
MHFPPPVSPGDVIYDTLKRLNHITCLLKVSVYQKDDNDYQQCMSNY